MTGRTMTNECWRCEYRRAINGRFGITCANPDPAMTGHTPRERQRWFAYPDSFDPALKTRDCANFRQSPEWGEP